MLARNVLRLTRLKESSENVVYIADCDYGNSREVIPVVVGADTSEQEIVRLLQKNLGVRTVHSLKRKAPAAVPMPQTARKIVESFKGTYKRVAMLVGTPRFICF